MNGGLLHVPFSGGQATDEALALEDAIHVVLQRLGLTRQFDAQLGQAPEDGGQAAIHQAELIAHEERHFSKDRGDTYQAFPQFLARLGDGRSGALRVVQDVHQHAPVTLDAVHQQAAVGAGDRVDRQQRRMGKTLVEVLHHDVRLIEHEIPVEQGRYGIVGVGLRQLLGVVVRLDIDDVDRYTLFCQHNAHPMTVLVSRIGKESHRRTLVGGNTHISTLILWRITVKRLRTSSVMQRGTGLYRKRALYPRNNNAPQRGRVYLLRTLRNQCTSLQYSRFSR